MGYFDNNPFIYIFKKNKIMLKKLLYIGCFLTMITSVTAQTLTAGDIAIIGVNFDTPQYELTIVTLAPIAANTQIRISDYWYNESTPNTLTNIQSTTGTPLNSEGGILWVPTVAIPQGSVFKIMIAFGTNTVTGLPGSVTITGWTDPLITATPSNQGGDNWFIYQGSSITNVSNFIFLWGNASPPTINTFPVTPGFFVTTGSGNINNNVASYLPPALTLGTNAIALTVLSTSGGYHGDNNVYVGTRTGNKATLLTEICKISNWNHDEAITYDINPGGSNFPGSNPIFIIPLGMKDFDMTGFNFYPNPTSDFLNIDYSKDITEVSIVNLLGQTLLNKKTNAAKVQLEITNLPKATYFVKIKSDGKEKTMKFIKQ